ncbi:regulator of nonsense transcripts 2 [Aphidius gifuensis]|uniref:regulator of nonsense transcripts 2 n=1 Tax=Aphidius gifuensis TaxID=684658 RepID=UPI001CDB52D7|nr:regulator of nonsense transcripts 2 [Aphidius gifuensis]
MTETEKVVEEQDDNTQQDAVEKNHEIPIISTEIIDHDHQYFDDYVRELEQRLSQKDDIRSLNINPTRPQESSFSKLDSNLKKNTTLVKKLRNFNASQLEQLLKDMSTLNLTKYVSEIAAALVDAKLKMTDINAAIKASSFMHQTYAEFSGHFFENWQRVLSLKINDKIINPSKLRVDLRFYAELVTSGIFTNKQGLSLLGSVLTVLINMDKEEHNNANIILSFCRHCGEDYAGLIPKRIRQLSEKYNIQIPKSKILTFEKQQNLRSLLRDYYNSLCRHLIKDYKELQSFEKHNKKILQTRGELSNERKDKLELLQLSYERLMTSVQNFSETLDESMPELPINNDVKIDNDDCLKLMMMNNDNLNNEDNSNNSSNNNSNNNNINSLIEDMWGDDETRRFYQVFPDLTVFLPGSYNNKDSIVNNKIDTIEENTTTATETTTPTTTTIINDEIIIDDDININLDDDDDDDDDVGVVVVVDDDDNTIDVKIDNEVAAVEQDTTSTSTSAVVTNISNKILLDAFLTHLPNCVNREMIDNAAVDFLMNLNTKHNKKKLIKALFGVSRIRLDLLPFYSRLAAILYPVMPDVGNDLCTMLKHDFKYHVRKKDQINIESKVKVVRYIGELVKFKLYTKIEALYCLKVLLHDFTHHHIEMACNLLEICGRYLFCSQDSHQRTKVYLEQMMRKKAVTALDSRYVTIIENAYYYVNPPETISGSTKKERPPIHEFIRKLLYQDLSKTNTDKILKLMRKLDWQDDTISSYIIKCLTAAYNVKYLNIRCIGSLLAGLVGHYETVGPHVVDGVLEDIRICMEINKPKYNQRRIAMVKYLGELYNYRMVESSDIFRTLYLLITFGINMDHNIPTLLDPPDHLFRIRLVCTLLETCGQYFSGGASKKKLDYYLIFFQNYYWFKYTHPIWKNENNIFPIDIEYMYRDTLTMLRPKMKLFTSYKESQDAIDELKKTFYPTLIIDEDNYDNNNHYDNGNGMDVIPEGDENLNSTINNNNDNNSHTNELNFEEVEDLSEALSDEDEWAVGDAGGGTTTTTANTATIAAAAAADDNTQDEQSLSQGKNNDNDIESGTVMDLSELNAALPQGPKRVQCPEDDDFLSALDKIVSDNIQDRMRENVKPSQVDISVPIHVKSCKKTYEQLQEGPSNTSTVDFVLMIRKGNKQQYKNLVVSETSDLAKNLRNREQEQKEEKERVKRLTLNITERQEEEDYQETINQGTKPVTVNLNRERRQKYNHPKGAPDADLIFGPKKIR